jgi:hypothetical protein
MSYQSPIIYESTRMHAAAIYCSDGRVGEQFDDFLQNGLGLPRYDRLALPGGPACLAGHTEAHLEEHGVVDELKFLVEVHKLSRVVLIQHQGCAFYSARLHLPQSLLDAQQQIDLVKAAYYIKRLTSIDNVDCIFAKHVNGFISFDRVELPSR